MPATSTAAALPPELLAHLDEGVLTLTLNRPHAGNLLTDALANALAAQLSLAASDPQVRCVVLAAAGSVFCSGADPGEEHGVAADPGSALHRRRALLRGTVARLHRLPKPTIAAVSGLAAGAGLALALACDLRTMVHTAVFTTDLARTSLPGDHGVGYFLTRLVGAAKARELCYLGDRVTADEALRLGLTNWLCAPQYLTGRTREIASRLVAAPPAQLACMKEGLHRAAHDELEACLDLEAAHRLLCGPARGLQGPLAVALHRTAQPRRRGPRHAPGQA